jgi:hypothetical protein
MSDNQGKQEMELLKPPHELNLMEIREVDSSQAIYGKNANNATSQAQSTI